MKRSKSKSRAGSVLANLAGVTLLVAVAIGLMFGASSVQANIILVEENFGGDGGDHGGTTGDLHGTNADIFSSAITGGNNTWAAGSQVWKDDGDYRASQSTGLNSNAYLNMGSYINDHKGNALGKFTLSATLSELPSGNWIGVTFFESDTPSTDTAWTGTGMGTLVYRGQNVGGLDAWAGPGTANPVSGPENATGDQLLTIVLDLTPDGGYNGDDNFGTVSFFQGDGTGTAFGSYTYTVERSFGSIGLSVGTPENRTAVGTVRDFQLTQIPEPSTLVLLGLSGLVALFGYRRRRM